MRVLLYVRILRIVTRWSSYGYYVNNYVSLLSFATPLKVTLVRRLCTGVPLNIYINIPKTCLVGGSGWLPENIAN